MNESYRDTVMTLNNCCLTKFENTLHYEHTCKCSSCHKLMDLSESETYKKAHPGRIYSFLFFCPECSEKIFDMPENVIKDENIISWELMGTTLKILRALDCPYDAKEFMNVWHRIDKNHPDENMKAKYKRLIRMYLRLYNMGNLMGYVYKDSLQIMLYDKIALKVSFYN